jgi:hypothetical protein
VLQVITGTAACGSVSHVSLGSFRIPSPQQLTAVNDWPEPLALSVVPLLVAVPLPAAVFTMRLLPAVPAGAVQAAGGITIVSGATHWVLEPAPLAASVALHCAATQVPPGQSASMVHVWNALVPPLQIMPGPNVSITHWAPGCGRTHVPGVTQLLSAQHGRPKLLLQTPMLFCSGGLPSG